MYSVEHGTPRSSVRVSARYGTAVVIRFPGPLMLFTVFTLVYAMMQFIGQLLLTVYSVIIIFGVFTANTELITVTQQFVTYIADIFSLSGPVCLFATRYAGSACQPLNQGGGERAVKSRN